MKVFAHNFNPQSNSGPNKFTRTLFASLYSDGLIEMTNQAEADVEFCLIQQQFHKVKPMVLRLDGIWFNSEQEYDKQNAPIQYSYKNADAVVFQSEFNKRLTEAWFGKHHNSFVVHNAADNTLIDRISKTYWNEKFGKDVEVWACASNWRPHKRLKDNVRYFKEFAPPDAIFAIAGGLGMDEAKEILGMDKRIHVLGNLDYGRLLSLYRRSSTFIHLSYLDHCPNVVVDAQASGCKIVCSSTGGTHEIVSNGIMVMEDEWDMKPCALYRPPNMDFSKTKTINVDDNLKLDFQSCKDKYFEIIKSLTEEK